jgi:hypothetical protein
MQGKKILCKALGGIIAFSLTTSALAIMSAPMGWYLEANGGSAKLSNVNYPGNSSSSGVGGNANLGYKFMPYVTAEIGYSLYPSSTISNAAGSKAATVKHYSYDLAARGILPMGDTGFEAFAKLGVQRITSNININNAATANNMGVGSNSSSATGLYMAAGAQYYFMPELALNVQWARAQGNSSTGNEDLFSGGISFIFD